VAAVGKRSEDEQRRERRESGVRARNGARQRHPSTATVDPSIREEALAIERLLDQSSERLSRMTATPLSRELNLVIERYRCAVREWPVQIPTPVQRFVLLDCVKALHDRVVLRSARESSGR
jgi:hypothetical protein